MFALNKSKEVELLHNQRERLLDQIKKVINGECSELEIDSLEDKEAASLINQLIATTKSKNNEYVERMNQSLKVVTKNSIIKEMLDTVSKQTNSIDHMKDSSKELGESISNITGIVEEVRESVSHAVGSTVTSVHNMNQSIEVVNQSTEDMNRIYEMVQEFKTKTAKINEIVDIVKQLAAQSNLLALNASIEAARAGDAGKGFGVVASEVKVMSESTTASAEDIMKYVKELQDSTDNLVGNIEQMSSRLQNGNSIVEKSVTDIQSINHQMEAINRQMEHIFSYVKKQDTTAGEFLTSIDGMSASYDELASLCGEAGKYVFTIIRESDRIRGALARFTANLDQKEWMDIFETDHIIFTWRLHNAVGKFEQLEVNSLRNSDGCKLGKWIASVKEEHLLTNHNFIALKKNHKELHDCAVKCYYEIQNNHLEEAEELYIQATQILNKLVQDIKAVKIML
ncbi:MAG: methyl-accepting chemotaxis protein [bacterium]|nr:methyl-accepting chemotaxis protein [bacterium]